MQAAVDLYLCCCLCACVRWQSLAKSCKLIPVMLMRVVVLGKRYALHEYLQVLLITAGICGFMLFEDGHKGSSAEGSSTSIVGFLLCLLSLALDGFTGPTQERINAQHRPSMAQMMFYLNLYAIGLVAALLLLTGQLWTGLAFFARRHRRSHHLALHTAQRSAHNTHIHRHVSLIPSLLLWCIGRSARRRGGVIGCGVVW